MLLKHLQFSVAFAFIFIVQLLMETDTITAKLVLADFHYVVKPLITASLMFYLFYHTQLKGRFSKRIFTGLIFGLIGDSLLMFVHINEIFFILGLTTFLLGHLAYISAFFIDYAWAKSIEKKSGILAIFIFGVFCIGFYWYLSPYLDDMKIPVMVYAVVISLMAVMAVNRKGRVSTSSYKWVFWGALLFVVSDSLLAYNKFVYKFNYAGAGIMATYMIAQFAITIGSIERKLKKHSVMMNTGN